MPRIDPQNFLHALATAIAAGLSITYTGSPRTLFIGPADESTVPADSQGRPACYTELRPYFNTIEFVGLPTVSVQARTVGFIEPEARARAAAIANFLLTADGRPKRNVTLPMTLPAPSFRLLGVLNIRGPSYVSRDAKNRPEIVVNFDCQYVPAA
jgi:hypothetical protein